MLPGLVDVAWGNSPIIATAIHDGHYVRPQVEDLFAITPEQRLCEEDPYTADLTEIVPTRLIGRRSRFEVDLNRPRHKAVYLSPDDAWGLDVWRESPPIDILTVSVEEYDLFYDILRKVLERSIASHGVVAVYDLHSYNYRRAGPNRQPADPALNPQVNVGTASLDHNKWGKVLDEFMRTLSSCRVSGSLLDVRENVRFTGGFLATWIHSCFPATACTFAIDIKKFFVDEWTGKVDASALSELRNALRNTVDVVSVALRERSDE